MGSFGQFWDNPGWPGWLLLQVWEAFGISLDSFGIRLDIVGRSLDRLGIRMNGLAISRLVGPPREVFHF